MEKRAQLTLSAALIAASFAAPSASRGTPDLRLLHGLLWGLKPSSAQAAQSIAVPPLPSRRDRLPNVVLVMGEGVRADVGCRGCGATPRLDALLPDRIELSELRSVATFTVVSMSAITTGRAQVVSRRELVSMPSV